MISNGEKDNMTRDELKLALEIYGGEVERMPEAMQQQVSALAAEDHQAKVLINQAKALDAHLLEDDMPVFDLAKCEASILKAINKEQAAPQAPRADNVIQIPINNKPKEDIDAPKEDIDANGITKREGANDNQLSSVAAAGLLAASLLFGVMFGSLGVPGFIEDSTSLTIASSELNDDLFYTGDNLTLDSDIFAISEFAISENE